MTIHTSHPFAASGPDRDPVRRLRGRLGGVVTLWTAGSGSRRAGLTVSSLMVAGGEPGRVLGLLDPDSDLAEILLETGLGLVHVLDWQHRDLADAFAGIAPAPGGLFAMAEFIPERYGPRLASAGTWAEVALESSTEVGWSLQVTCLLDRVQVAETSAESDDPLVHRRGRYRRAPRPGSQQSG